MLVAFWAVLPVFLIIGMGVFLRARDLLPDSTGKVLGLYVLKLALPLLLLHVLSQAGVRHSIIGCRRNDYTAKKQTKT